MDDKVRQTFAAMQAAEGDYFSRIQRIINGDATANEGMEEVIQAMKRARDGFHKAAEPYTRRGRKIRDL